MLNEQIIKCTFCKGTGNNPHFRGTCPVCKGRGKNKVIGKYMTCSSCRGLGQKKGTTLTCYDCGGTGVIPDTRETFRKALEEIGEAKEQIARERQELTEKPKSKKHKLLNMFSKRKGKEDQGEEEFFDLTTTLRAQDRKEEEIDEKTHFCQCCADKVNNSITIKICSDCFRKMKEIA